MHCITHVSKCQKRELMLCRWCRSRPDPLWGAAASYLVHVVSVGLLNEQSTALRAEVRTKHRDGNSHKQQQLTARAKAGCPSHKLVHRRQCSMRSTTSTHSMVGWLWIATTDGKTAVVQLPSGLPCLWCQPVNLFWLCSLRFCLCLLLQLLMCLAAHQLCQLRPMQVQHELV